MDVVVVESPTKAGSIGKYLGDGYQVLATYGHVRDLPPEDGSVDPEHDFAMRWQVLDEKRKHEALDKIAKAVRHATRVVLATDPDREGEAISWHVLEVLKEKKAIDGKPVERVVFNEVTKKAVLEAMANARQIDPDLVDAYRARRALDYLVGFTLSPVLWRKLQGSRSAGRVQSVALRLICEREAEIEAFRAREYWTVEALLATERAETLTARLVELDGRKLDRFALPDEASARAAVAAIEAARLAVANVERKQVTRNPAPPFSTSTLQQEASRKLGFSASRTMQVAQRLFEGVDLGGETVGLITYMRTDSVSLSGEALAGSRRLIGDRFGERYLPGQPRQFKTKAKNAQEAHEAVRPTDFFRLPQDVGRYLESDQRRLYELIWKRTVASQMAAALLDRVAADIKGERVALRATGQTVAFDGFLKLYREDRDDRPAEGEDDDEDTRILPPLVAGQGLAQREVRPEQHFTEPPPRFTEASLVKRMEELGIGRPSTYASIISVLQDRDYVRLEQKRFMPEARGRLVTGFLVAFFDRWVQAGFTAELEDKLDDVAAGGRLWRDVLREFWEPFVAAVGEVKELRVGTVIEALNEAMAPQLFLPRPDGADPRRCPSCEAGTLSLRVGKFGAFVGCSNYPECRYTRELGGPSTDAPKERCLGVDPGTAEEVWLKAGRFGPYLQRGTGPEPVRSSLPPGYAPGELDLDTALKILALPRTIGTDPNTSEPVKAVLNRFGAFVECGSNRRKLDADDDVLQVGLNRALVLLSEPARKGERVPRASATLKPLGVHPDDGKPIQLSPTGRFGPYVKHGSVFASLPKSLTPDEVTLERALELLRAKAARDGGSPKKGARGKASGAKVAGAKPAAAPARKAKPQGTKARKAPAKRPAARRPAGTPVESG